MELNEYDAIIRHLVAIDVHLQSNIDDLRMMHRQQLVLITELQSLNREQAIISQRLLRLLENVTGQSSNGNV